MLVFVSSAEEVSSSDGCWLKAEVIEVEREEDRRSRQERLLV